MEILDSKDTQSKLDSFPPLAKKKISALRSLIITEAKAIEGITTIEESLKWGELSYKVKYGSPIRINWSPKHPDRYSIYFNCQSLIVPTIRSLYGDTLTYEKTRAIHLDIKSKMPKEKLSLCIRLALKYHKIKHLPLLGQ